jgi:hypothetical protein
MNTVCKVACWTAILVIKGSPITCCRSVSVVCRSFWKPENPIPAACAALLSELEEGDKSGSLIPNWGRADMTLASDKTDFLHEITAKLVAVCHYRSTWTNRPVPGNVTPCYNTTLCASWVWLESQAHTKKVTEVAGNAGKWQGVRAAGLTWPLYSMSETGQTTQAVPEPNISLTLSPSRAAVSSSMVRTRSDTLNSPCWEDQK